MHMTTVHGVVQRLASQVTIAPQAAVYSTDCEINSARKPLCICIPATGTFVKPSECCNQVEVSAGVQSRSVRLIVLRAGIRGHEARRLAISLSTSRRLPGGFRPVFW